MAAIDSLVEPVAPVPKRRGHIPHFALAVATAGLIALGGLALRAGGVNGWRLAAEFIWRFSSLLFLAAFIAVPLARLSSGSKGNVLAGRYRALAIAFAGAHLVFLFCVLAPGLFAPISLLTVSFCFLDGLALSVLIMPAASPAGRFLGPRLRRCMQAIASVFFWLLFALAGLDHLYGPHRPDGYYGFILCALIAALIVKFADAFKRRRAAILA